MQNGNLFYASLQIIHDKMFCFVVVKSCGQFVFSKFVNDSTHQFKKMGYSLSVNMYFYFFLWKSIAKPTCVF